MLAAILAVLTGMMTAEGRVYAQKTSSIASSPKHAPVVVADDDDDDDGPDQAGKDQILNRQLWERMKGTPYEVALEHIARVRKEGTAPAAPSLVELPNGWKIAPAGEQVAVGRLPYEAVAFADKIVVLGNGYYTGDDKPEISIVDPLTRETKTITVPTTKDALYPSAIVGPGSDLYVSGGIGRKVYRYNKNFELVNTYNVDGYAAGLTMLDDKHIAVAYLMAGEDISSDKDGDNVGVNRKGRLAVLNTDDGKVGASQPVGYFPSAIRFVQGKIYVTLQGEDRIAVYTPRLDLLKTIPTGRSPQDIAVDGDRLYVVNANSDNLTVVDATSDTVVKTLDLRLDANRFGNAPTSCVVDGGRLYVTLANVNAVEVMDKASGKRLGLIPTGWYPTKALIQGDHLFTVSAKGIQARRPNPTETVNGKSSSRYILTLLQGSLGIIPRGDIDSHLSAWTKTAQDSNPINGVSAKVLPPIKHIIYIVRENRTYDQVLGDLGRGNGDPQLTLFGADITPNAHKICRDFVTLDNYYADGEISVLGHSFTTSGYASPLLEWVANTSYSGRYKGYPFGTVPAVTSPAYLWDALDAQKLDYRVYGENYFLYTRGYAILARFFGPDSDLAKKFYAQSMALASVTDRGNRFYRFASPFYGQAQTPEAALKLLENPEFTKTLSDFLVGDGTLADALAKNAALRKAFAEYLYHYPFNYRSWDTGTSDMDRARAWINDFNDQVQRGKVAPLHYIWLPNDHTGGKLAPDQMVAQNDAALGRILETISHSPVWKDSLVLITEDDAQAGPDHVDATRTVGLAFGPYVRRNAVVSDRYDQLSLLRTIGVLLGFPPLNRDDALAVPMYGIFTDTPDLNPYTPATPSTHLASEDQTKYAAFGK